MFSKGKMAPDYFTLRSTYFQGRPPKSVNMHWRRFAVSSIPINDPVAFEQWVLARWKEKDELLETFYNTGRFPADIDQKAGGYIETEVRLKSRLEIGQIFVVLATLALICNVVGKLWTMMFAR
jgi:lysocardiolipin and lysophospholipid acyltransferase